MKFSVVVPLFNKKPYIRRCIESVLQQSFNEFELIVVDDGSTDGGLEELAGIDDPRLLTLQQKNSGVGFARNAGMKMARAPWIALLDADDAWLPDHLDELRKIAEFFPGAGLISTAYMEVTGSKLPNLPSSQFSQSIREVDYFLEASKKIGFISAASAAVKRQIFYEVGGFTKEKVGEDLEYWARVALSYPVAVSDRVTCLYFRDTGGVMHQNAQNSSFEKTKTICELREVSPSVAMLCEHAIGNPEILKNSNIRSYVNGTLENRVKGALYRVQVAKAREYAKLFMRSPTPKQYLYCFIVRAPSWLIYIGVMGIRRCKNLARTIKVF